MEEKLKLWLENKKSMNNKNSNSTNTTNSTNTSVSSISKNNNIGFTTYMKKSTTNTNTNTNINTINNTPMKTNENINLNNNNNGLNSALKSITSSLYKKNILTTPKINNVTSILSSCLKYINEGKYDIASNLLNSYNNNNEFYNILLRQTNYWICKFKISFYYNKFNNNDMIKLFKLALTSKPLPLDKLYLSIEELLKEMKCNINIFEMIENKDSSLNVENEEEDEENKKYKQNMNILKNCTPSKMVLKDIVLKSTEKKALLNSEKDESHEVQLLIESINSAKNTDTARTPLIFKENTEIFSVSKKLVMDDEESPLSTNKISNRTLTPVADRLKLSLVDDESELKECEKENTPLRFEERVVYELPEVSGFSDLDLDLGSEFAYALFQLNFFI